MAENTLYSGDNLKTLRDHIRDQTVDLIYLDPPFNGAFGFDESLGTTIFPKLQILTVKGLLDGTVTASYPDLTRGGLTFKKAKKEKTAEQLTLGDEEATF